MSRKGVLDMAHTVNVNFKLDEDVKKRMERACAEMGLSMSAAFTMFAKKVGREYRIPFEVSADPFYSESNLRHLESVMHVSGTFRTGCVTTKKRGQSSDGSIFRQTAHRYKP